MSHIEREVLLYSLLFLLKGGRCVFAICENVSTVEVEMTLKTATFSAFVFQMQHNPVSGTDTKRHKKQQHC